jgi:hypothetical protein
MMAPHCQIITKNAELARLGRRMLIDSGGSDTTAVDEHHAALPAGPCKPTRQPLHVYRYATLNSPARHMADTVPSHLIPIILRPLASNYRPSGWPFQQHSKPGR